jgi:hypothetical protein
MVLKWRLRRVYASSFDPLDQLLGAQKPEGNKVRIATVNGFRGGLPFGSAYRGVVLSLHANMQLKEERHEPQSTPVA